MGKTDIEWATHTVNPFVGCTRISAGCQHCYAIGFAWRHQAMFGAKDERYRGLVGRRCPFCKKIATVSLPGHWFRCEYCGGTFLKEKSRLDWTGKVSFFPERFKDIEKAPKGSRIFLDSMSDFFHEKNFDHYAHAAIFEVMGDNPDHTYMLLTKRPEKMREAIAEHDNLIERIPNLWLGVTVENQVRAEERIPELLKLRPSASKLFVSVEPLLGPVSVIKNEHCYIQKKGGNSYCDDGICPNCDDWNGIDWIICGPESGPGKREFREEWALDLRDQCKAAGVPFFYKGGKLAGETFNEFPNA